MRYTYIIRNKQQQNNNKLFYRLDGKKGHREKNNMQKYNVITLCGSTRFKDEFMAVQKKLTLEGNIVISLGVFAHSGDIISNEEKIMLCEMHKRKIDMSDEIFVINVDGYIGDSTRSEIEYAKLCGKKIRFMINK
jgi:hypothetical protein